MSLPFESLVNMSWKRTKLGRLQGSEVISDSYMCGIYENQGRVYLVSLKHSTRSGSCPTEQEGAPLQIVVKQNVNLLEPFTFKFKNITIFIFAEPSYHKYISGFFGRGYSICEAIQTIVDYY